jgi:DNA invertase Pin-like site-specific DNA recombinase
MNFAQFERRLIGERTKAALAVKRSQGVRLGRKPVLEDKLVRRIRRLHDDGASLGAIARQLNDDAIPTAHGGAQWYASTVRSVLQRSPA